MWIQELLFEKWPLLLISWRKFYGLQLAQTYMKENDVKSICRGTKSDFKVKKDEKFMIQTVTRRKFSIQILKRCEDFNSNSYQTKKS